jgi:hypothetical protein
MSVRDEIEKGDDTLADWARGIPALFLEDDEDVQLMVRSILENWPRLADFNRFLKGADPFVIALARCRGFTVVASEKLSGNLNHPKIPDACRHYGVRCIRAMDMFEELGWQF